MILADKRRLERENSPVINRSLKQSARKAQWVFGISDGCVIGGLLPLCKEDPDIFFEYRDIEEGAIYEIQKEKEEGVQVPFMMELMEKYGLYLTPIERKKAF